MGQSVNEPSTPSHISPVQALRHFFVAGLLAGIFGVAVSALVFYLLVLGLLYAGQPVQGTGQTALPIPQLSDIVLAPPIAAVDLEPPAGKREGTFDGDYLGACARLVWQSAAQEDVGLSLLAWATGAALAAWVLGLVGLMIRLLLGERVGPLLGILALLTAAAAIVLLVGHCRFHWEIPFELDVAGRLALDAVVTGASLLWITIVGFRFRALLFPALTALIGEALVFGLPPPVWTTTALWHVSLFLLVPAGYAWLVVERGQEKRVISAA